MMFKDASSNIDSHGRWSLLVFVLEFNPSKLCRLVCFSAVGNVRSPEELPMFCGRTTIALRGNYLINKKINSLETENETSGQTRH